MAFLHPLHLFIAGSVCQTPGNRLRLTRLNHVRGWYWRGITGWRTSLIWGIVVLQRNSFQRIWKEWKVYLLWATFLLLCSCILFTFFYQKTFIYCPSIVIHISLLLKIRLYDNNPMMTPIDIYTSTGAKHGAHLILKAVCITLFLFLFL